MSTLRSAISEWISEAEAGAENGLIPVSLLKRLEGLRERSSPRQRLLYLHARTPSITSPVIGMAQHEPVEAGTDELRTRSEWPYATVHEAIIDGWQVIQLPDPMAQYDDRELSYVGYEFVLQKIEEVVHE